MIDCSLFVTKNPTSGLMQDLLVMVLMNLRLRSCKLDFDTLDNHGFPTT